MTINSIRPSIRKEIMVNLKKVEKEHNVTILYAVESGSRAWGFESKDSDYDVRFIYQRKRDDYLPLGDEIRDTIQHHVSKELDIDGWDIEKALKLFYKANPAFIEWLHSPIVYLDNGMFAKACRKLANRYFQSHKVIYHHMSLVKPIYYKFVEKEQVNIKKYLYALRSIFAAKWVEEYNTVPPIELERLLVGVTIPNDLKREIQVLVSNKAGGLESDVIDKLPAVEIFICNAIAEYEVNPPIKKEHNMSWEPLNKLMACSLNVAEALADFEESLEKLEKE